MSTNIISAIRHCAQLKGNVKFTAIEVAHLMNSSGYGRVAYQMMAYKTGYSRRTAINHMHKLVAMGIVAKTVYRLKFGNAINLYKCLLPLARLSRTQPTRAQSESAARMLPTPKTEEKALSLEEELEQARKGLRFLTNPDSPMYQACLAHIARLEALRRTT